MISIPRDEYEALKAQNKELAQQVQWLMEQMRLSKQKQFGSSSEKSKYDTLNLFNELDHIVQEARGRLYLAKDARMPKTLFEAGYPRIQEFMKYRDPGISSNMSRRLLGV